jgi:hypothetical protein
MPDAQILIGTITLTSTQTSIVFSNLPQTYRDLHLTISTSMPSAASPAWRANNDSGSNYASVGGYYNTTTASSMSNTGQTQGAIGFWPASPAINDPIIAILDLLDYSTTDKHKTVVTRTNQTSSNTDFSTSRWASTAAVTSLTILGWGGAGSFAAGSIFTLYGVLA